MYRWALMFDNLFLIVVSFMNKKYRHLNHHNEKLIINRERKKSTEELVVKRGVNNDTFWHQEIINYAAALASGSSAVSTATAMRS